MQPCPRQWQSNGTSITGYGTNTKTTSPWSQFSRRMRFVKRRTGRCAHRGRRYTFRRVPSGDTAPQHCSAPWAAPSQPDERPYAVTYGAASLSTERELSRKYRNCIQIQIYTTGAYVSMLSRLCAVIARFWFNRSKFRLAIYSFLCQRT